jgi:hypothetical protein
MKIKYSLFSCLLSAVCLFACNTDEDTFATGGDIDITEKLPEGTFDREIKNLHVTSLLHGITIEWTAPDDLNSLNFYWVEWKGITSGSVFSKSVKKGVNELEITRLNNEEYQITVQCVSSMFLYSEGVSMNGSPIFDTTAPQAISGLSVQPYETSAVLEWTNPDDPDFEDIKIEVWDIQSGAIFVTMLIPADKSDYTVGNLAKTHEYRISISAMDYLGNTSEPVSADTKTVSYRESMLGKTPAWEIVSFSTEETSEATSEGDGTTGRAADAIDSDENTFWHSQWTNGGSSLPQHIVFDVHQEVLPKRLVCYKRKNNSNGPETVKIEGSVDGTVWYDFGTFEIDGKSDDGQECMLTGTRNVRYFKYTVLKSGNGYAMVRNIDLLILTPR